MPENVLLSAMRRLIPTYALFLLAPLLIACTQHTDNQDEIRKKAADAAADVKKGVKEFDKDAKAAAQGAKEGWDRDEQKKPRADATRPHHSPDE